MTDEPNITTEVDTRKVLGALLDALGSRLLPWSSFTFMDTNIDVEIDDCELTESESEASFYVVDEATEHPHFDVAGVSYDLAEHIRKHLRKLGVILCRKPQGMRSVFWRPRKARAGEMYAYVRQATARRVNITIVSIPSSREMRAASTTRGGA